MSRREKETGEVYAKGLNHIWLVKMLIQVVIKGEEGQGGQRAKKVKGGKEGKVM